MIFVVPGLVCENKISQSLKQLDKYWLILDTWNQMIYQLVIVNITLDPWSSIHDVCQSISSLCNINSFLEGWASNWWCSCSVVVTRTTRDNIYEELTIRLILVGFDSGLSIPSWTCHFNCVPSQPKIIFFCQTSYHTNWLPCLWLLWRMRLNC